MQVNVNGSELVFDKQPDGWFTNTINRLAISPDKTTCITDPWYADYVSEAPTHNFTITAQ